MWCLSSQKYSFLTELSWNFIKSVWLIRKPHIAARVKCLKQKQPLLFVIPVYRLSAIGGADILHASYCFNTKRSQRNDNGGMWWNGRIDLALGSNQRWFKRLQLCLRLSLHLRPCLSCSGGHLSLSQRFLSSGALEKKRPGGPHENSLLSAVSAWIWEHPMRLLLSDLSISSDALVCNSNGAFLQTLKCALTVCT